MINFTPSDLLGTVNSVDTTKIIINAASLEALSKARVGFLTATQAGTRDEYVIGIITRLWKDPEGFNEQVDENSDVEELIPKVRNGIQINLIATYKVLHVDKPDYFTRSILALPDVMRETYVITGKNLEFLMSVIANASISNGTPLELGTFTLDSTAKAFINGDKFFQRHAAILGSTGSGKSWTVASILEQAFNLKQPNIVVFDVHGEYSKLPYVNQFKIAGPSGESSGQNTLYLPFWLLGYEEFRNLFIEKGDANSPNQASALIDAVITAKKSFIQSLDDAEIYQDNFTIDSPIPFSLEEFIEFLRFKNSERIEGSTEKGKQGPLFDKLTRMLIRINAKITDKRFSFMFNASAEVMRFDYLNQLAVKLLGTNGTPKYSGSGIKVIDFSEVPSEILPTVISTFGRLLFEIQQWSSITNEQKHPVLLICDEAHLYLPRPDSGVSSSELNSLYVFERIAKEGRKYGAGLCIVSQRPSDLSTTILSQCNNLISLRLSNESDRSVVRSLLPESLHGLLEILPSLEIGEGVVVGDAILLPSRVRISIPKHQPISSTIDFWSEWNKDQNLSAFEKTIKAYRRQSKS